MGKPRKQFDTLQAWCHWMRSQGGVSEYQLEVVSNIEALLSQVGTFRAERDKLTIRAEAAEMELAEERKQRAHEASRAGQAWKRAEAAEKEVERLHREGCIPREADEAGTRLGYDETEKWKKYAWAKSCEAEGRGKLVGELNAELESCQADCAALRLALGKLKSMADDCQQMSRHAADVFTKTIDNALQRPAGAALLEELRAARGVVEAAREVQTNRYPERSHVPELEKAVAAYDRAAGEK